MQRFVDEVFNGIPDDAWWHEDGREVEWTAMAIRDLAAAYYLTPDPTEWQCRAIRRAGGGLTHGLLPDAVPRGYLVRVRSRQRRPMSTTAGS